MNVRVDAPSRIHFGLLHVPTDGVTHWPDGTLIRRFGGVGLIVDEPGLSVRVEAAGEWSAGGPSGDRALEFARRFVAADPGAGGPSYRITVERCPAEHVGLGVGTQLGLAVARALSALTGQSHVPARDLATRVGRGERSGVGIHGFESGGLIVDGGQGDAPGVSTLVARYEFPRDWRAVLIIPDQPSPWHGERERAVFARPRPADESLRTTERLCRLALTGIAPAVCDGDFAAFADSTYEFNRTAGLAFAADQGDTYSGRVVSAVIREVRENGFPGAGQSSWGPCVFGFAEDPDRAQYLAGVIRERFAGLREVLVTPASTAGAIVLSGG